MAAFPATTSALRRNAFFLLLFCCLCLAGCASKLPDSGSLESVAVRKETPFYLDVSAERVQEKGMCPDGLAAAIEKRLLTVDGMKAVDQPGPGTLVVRVDVRELYLAGMTRKNYRSPRERPSLSPPSARWAGPLPAGRRRPTFSTPPPTPFSAPPSAR